MPLEFGEAAEHREDQQGWAWAAPANAKQAASTATPALTDPLTLALAI